MQDNELLAQWLGKYPKYPGDAEALKLSGRFEYCSCVARGDDAAHSDACPFWKLILEVRQTWPVLSAPDFRTSNEWAGALLEKLGTARLLTHFYCDGPRSWYLYPCDAGGKNGFWTKPAPTWRDAVVDAALIIARQEIK